ncbi:family 78 glycoside hydrolase catalytic domain [Photobacterium rosenbergii]|uniref:alpha-L-rhamnosidase n=1 Tax=Photobacterium rosenbergii TaxID=294936 RepID=A0ABU3ZNB4_9GAMM|nr:family 78 glycoside hydrolase catalytic domain [Photobacterium rosenbergii]
MTKQTPWVDDQQYYDDRRNLVIKKSLHVSDATEEAYINIVGLGYYNLYINGNKVSNYELNNDWTNYSKIVYYDTFDILAYLKQGENEILVELANGWYHPAPVTLFGKYNLRNNLTTGQPMLLAEVIVREQEHEHTFATDESWVVAEGPYLFNNMYLGEVIDFRLINRDGGKIELLDTEWVNVVETTGPEGVLKPSFIDKITRSRELTPAEVYSLEPTRHIIDFGEMVSGFIDASFTGKDGLVVEFLYSEEINADKTLNTDSTLAGFVGKEVAENVIVPGGEGAPARAEQRDRCICRDGVMSFSNQFTYHSFRYVEVTGLTLAQLNHVKAVYAHTSLNDVGHFHCSDNDLNYLYQVAKTTKLNNIHSVIEDCARERLAYGGDMVALANSQAMMFDSANLYEKTIDDFIADRMDNGGFPETAPFMGIQTKGTGEGAGPLGWQLAVPYLLKTHYRYYGNIELVKRVFPYLEAQLTHIKILNADDIADFCLGDWGSKIADQDNVKWGSPALSFTAACFYYYHLNLLTEFAAILGLADKRADYQQQADSVKSGLVEKYRNDDGSYADKSQTSYVFALYFELESDHQQLVASLDKLVRSAGYDVECGIFGQSFFYTLAHKYDFNHLVQPWLNNALGLKHMLDDGNGALKEFFGDNFNGSCNHAMFSSYISWFYNGLAGIAVCDDACGADKVVVKPYLASNIAEVKASYLSASGKVGCQWLQNSGITHLSVQVPAGVKECTLILDRKYLSTISPENIKYLDEKHVHIDITGINELNLELNTDLVSAEECC